MKVGIIGCGLIGQKRSRGLAGAELAACADTDLNRAGEVSRQGSGVLVTDRWEKVVGLKEIDIVVVSTRHDSLAAITLGAIRAGKHVLVEKPAARSASELEPVLRAAEAAGVRVRVGYNHRFHPALQKARQIVDEGGIGELMFLRSRYGHGGRTGYEREWRADPVRSGGGELIDQGVHLIDLARWFLGDFVRCTGFAHTYFWNMPVDDNAFLLLRTEKEQAAFLHASCTEWKNLFSMEIYGKTGKLHVEGLGGSYGIERLSYYKMLPEMGPPETKIWEYPMGDRSWENEFSAFLEDIRLKRRPRPDLADAWAALSIVGEIYRESGYDHHP